MKIIKTILAIFMAAAFGLRVSAQQINATKVPAVVKNAFSTAYPGVKTVKWEKEKGDYEAGFMQGSKEMSAVFTANGTQLESEMKIKVADLPASILAYVKEHYKGASIKEAAKITKTSTGEINYEAEVKGQDLIFSADGKFIKAMKD